MSLILQGVNHKTADVSVREKLAYPESTLTQALKRFCDNEWLHEIVILSTCNRTEWFCRIEEGYEDHLLALIQEDTNVCPTKWQEAAYCLVGREAITHLMRVACGLDSMVVGEPQILGQIKAAYRLAKDVGSINNQLDRLYQRVFATAKQVRTETAIGMNAVSVAYVAVNLAKHIFADIKHTKALLVGAGDTIERVAVHLAEQRVQSLVVANRTYDRAKRLVEKVTGNIHDASAIAMVDIPKVLGEVDVVFSSTASSLPIIGKGMVERALAQGRRRPYFMVDLAVPRDIEPEVGEMEDVYLYTVDDLHSVVGEGVTARKEAAKDAESMIQLAADDCVGWLRSLDSVHMIRQYRRQMVSVKDKELTKALVRIESGEPVEVVLKRFAHNLLNKVMHEPCTQMRQAGFDGQTDSLETARTLLGLKERTKK